MAISQTVLLLDKRTQGLIKDYVPNDEIIGDLVGFFNVFSDVTRLKIVSSLAISEMCVTDLSIMLSLNQTTVSHQLRILKDVGVVKCKRQGKIIFYSLRDELINEILLKGVEFLGY
ncbi:MAG: helix-turn-helix transcriptional regulator [Clostridia bacterium]|nr:helix-turn-helix transcriptional regulator [Clostridia bacterium]